MKSNSSADLNRIRLPEKLGYAAGDTASVLYIHTFGQFLMYYYTDVFGLMPAAVGTMFLLTRLFDAVNDPMMGVIADRTSTKYGKFRPWLLWGIIPYMVLGVLTFFAPEFSDNGKLIYAYVTYIGVSIVYTMVNIPYGALMGVMTPHSEERTSLAAFRFYGAYAGVFLVNLTLLKMVSVFGQGDEKKGFLLSMVVYALIAGTLFLITFITTKERVKPTVEQQEDFWGDLALLRQNKPWLAIFGIGLTTLVWITMRGSATMFYLKYCILADETLTTFFLTAGTAATLIGVGFTKLVERKLGGKKRAYIILTLSVAVITCGYYFGSPAASVYTLDINLLPGNGPLKFNVDLTGSLYFLLAINCLSAGLTGPLLPMFWSMIADTADYSEWKFGRRFTGLIFSAGTFSHKSGMAIGAALAGWYLAFLGYQANTEQGPESIEGIRQMMSFIPSIIGVFGAIAISWYGITPALARQIETELAARHSNAS